MPTDSTNINFNKTMGFGLILPKLENIVPGQFSDPVTCTINPAITLSIFPNKAKEASVTPVDKDQRLNILFQAIDQLWY